MPPALGLPPTIQNTSRGNDRSAFSVESAFVALLSLMNSTLPTRPTSSIRCGRPGNDASAPCQIEIGGSTEPIQALANRRNGSECVLRIMPPAQRRNPRQRAKLDGERRTVAADDRTVEQTVSRRERLLRTERYRGSALDAPLQHREAKIVIDTDGRDLGPLNDALFDGGVILYGAVTIEMIRRDIQHHAHRRIERRRQIDLERRHLDDVKPIGRWFVERQDRAADIAAELRVVTGVAKNMRDQRRRRRFAVRTGNRNERRLGRTQSPLAREHFDIANDLDTVLTRLVDGPMRHGVGQRHARRQHER